MANKPKKLRAANIAVGMSEAELRKLLDKPGIGTSRGHWEKGYYKNEVEKVMYESSIVIALCVAAHAVGMINLSRDRQKSGFFILNHVAGMPVQKHEVGEISEPARDYLDDIKEYLRKQLTSSDG